MTEDRLGTVYFLEADLVKRVALKVGWTAKQDAISRIRDLQVGCPVQLKLIATVPGYRDDERWYHQHFAPVRIHGEWFELTPSVYSLVTMFTATEYPSPRRTPVPQCGLLRSVGVHDASRGPHRRAQVCDLCTATLNSELVCVYSSYRGYWYYACPSCAGLDYDTFECRPELNERKRIVRAAKAVPVAKKAPPKPKEQYVPKPCSFRAALDALR